ncbi:MAG: NAD(P)H-dependent oxidoreductase subunit E, partial [Candidatus Muiribacteriaceae bacterium]
SVCRILENHAYSPSKLIAILSEIQDEYRYLPEEVMNFVATSLKIPPARVFGVATFYSHFAFRPKGKYVVKICDGTACHVKDSIPILEAMKDYLGLEKDKITTGDLLFTVETVSCLGACGLAPVITINDEVHGLMTPEKAVELLKGIRNEEDKEKEVGDEIS